MGKATLTFYNVEVEIDTVEAINKIAEILSPDQVFPESELRQWAIDNGFREDK